MKSPSTVERYFLLTFRRYLLIVCLPMLFLQVSLAQKPIELLKSLDIAQTPATQIGLLAQVADHYADQKNLSKALEFLAKAMKINDREATFPYDHKSFTSVLQKAIRTVSFDSLKMAFNALPKDAQGPGFYNLFAYEAIYDLDPDYAIALGKKALDLSKASKNTLQEGESNFNIGQMMYYTDKTNEDEAHFLAALKIFQKITDTLGMIKSKLSLSSVYRWRLQTEKSVQYANQAVSLAHAIGDSKQLSEALEKLLKIKKWQGEYGEVQQIIKKLYDLAYEMETEDPSWLLWVKDIEASYLMSIGNHNAALPLVRAVARSEEENKEFYYLPLSYFDLANCYWKTGVYDSAMIYLQQSIDYAKEYHNEYMFRESLMHLAFLHFEIGDNETGMEYSSQMNQHFATAEYTDIVDFNEHQTEWKILFFEKTGQLDSALYYAKRSLASYQEKDLNSIVTSRLLMVGKLYRQQSQSDLAQTFLQKALQNARKIGQHGQVAASLLHLAEADIDRLDFQSALAHASASLEIAEEYQMTHLLPDIYKSLSVAHAKTGGFQMAYQYQFLLDQLQDSLLGFVQKQQIAKHESLYRLKEKQLENKRLQVEKEQRDFIIRKKTSQVIALAGILVFIVIAAYLYKERAKLQAENKLRKQITRDIHDDVGSTLNSLKLTIKEAIEEDANKQVTQSKLSKAVQLGNQAMESLKELIWKMDQEQPTLKSIARELDKFTQMMLTDHQIPFQLHVSGFEKKRPLPFTKSHNFLMIYKEAVNNAVKHGDRKSISINLSSEENNVTLVVKNSLPKVQAAEMGTSKGLQNMKKRAADLNGHLVLNKTEDSFELILTFEM